MGLLMQKLKHAKFKQGRHMLTVYDLLYPLRCLNDLFLILLVPHKLMTDHEIVLDLEACLFHPFVGEGGLKHIEYL
jgi:hypothetical protein